MIRRPTDSSVIEWSSSRMVGILTLVALTLSTGLVLSKPQFGGFNPSFNVQNCGFSQVHIVSVKCNVLLCYFIFFSATRTTMQEEEHTDPLNLINPQTSSSRSLHHTTNRIVFSDNAIRTTLEETTEEPSEGERGRLRLPESVFERSEAVRRPTPDTRPWCSRRSSNSTDISPTVRE